MSGYSERDWVQSVSQNMRAAEISSQDLGPIIYAIPERRIRTLRPGDNPRDYYPLTQSDMGRGAEKGSPRVILSQNNVRLWSGKKRRQKIGLREWDCGQVYSCLGIPSQDNNSVGIVDVIRKGESSKHPPISGSNHCVHIVIESLNASGESALEDCCHVEAFVSLGSKWRAAEVEIADVEGDLFSRHRGVLETNKLKESRVLVVGLGSIGSTTTRQLAQAGVGTFYIVDHDILSVHNISRHESPIEHLGRKKVCSMVDIIHSKNPNAVVYEYDVEITRENIDLVYELVGSTDLTIWGADTHGSRSIGNRVCVEEDKTLIMSGFRHRAFAGQVLRIRPWESLCYQCYVMQSPGELEDREVSTPSGARIGAYADRPVPIEPGLSTWIEPVSTMMSLLAIQELLRGKTHTLDSLDEDLAASYFLWLNRREPGTPFAALPPLGFEVNGLAILRWYGLPLKRHPGCPVCGDLARDRRNSGEDCSGNGMAS